MSIAKLPIVVGMNMYDAVFEGSLLISEFPTMELELFDTVKL